MHWSSRTQTRLTSAVQPSHSHWAAHDRHSQALISPGHAHRKVPAHGRAVMTVMQPDKPEGLLQDQRHQAEGRALHHDPHARKTAHGRTIEQGPGDWFYSKVDCRDRGVGPPPGSPQDGGVWFCRLFLQLTRCDLAGETCLMALAAAARAIALRQVRGPASRRRSFRMPGLAGLCRGNRLENRRSFYEDRKFGFQVLFHPLVKYRFCSETQKFGVAFFGTLVAWIRRSVPALRFLEDHE